LRGWKQRSGPFESLESEIRRRRLRTLGEE
jgi:hypothetical protein